MAQRTRSDSPTKTCTADECDRPLRAKGLCAYHYRIANPPTKTNPVECPTCGTVTMKRDKDRRFCSLICRDLWRIEQPSDPMFQNKQRICRLPADHPAVWYGLTCALAETVCSVCASPFMHRPNNRRVTCSRQCANQVRQLRKRGRKQIRRSSIFQRDGYVCWICDLPTSERYAANDPLSPTIDHLVPRAFGGGDEPDNIATAHMICNARRGASWGISPAA